MSASVSTDATEVTITDSLIFGNTAKSGGGVASTSSSGHSLIATVGRSTIAGNRATAIDQGGGIKNSGANGTLTVTDSTISGNRVPNTAGGGIFNEGVAKIINSTISGNYAGTGAGDGIATYSTASLEAVNATIAGNTAAFGGGLFVNQGGLSITNTIVTGNRTPSGTGNDIQSTQNAPPITSNSSLVGVITNATLDFSVNGNIQESEWMTVLENDGTNPILKNNGGPTATIALIPDSPAIDNGNDDLAKDAGGNALDNDQRGAPFLRKHGASGDIGAYEVQTLGAEAFVVTTLNDERDYSNNSGASPQVSLREAISSANGSANGATPEEITFASSLFTSARARSRWRWASWRLWMR